MTRLVSVAANPSIDRLVEVDRLVPGTIHRPDRVRSVPGGKGLNVARAAALLGVDVVAVGILAGHAGRWVAASLSALGVDCRFAWTSGETRTATSVADRSDGSMTEFYERGPQVDATAWRELEALVATAIAEDVAVLAMAGTLPPGAPADGYARLVRTATARGIEAIVDAGDAALEAAIAAGPWLIKVNAAEAASVVGRRVTPDDALEAADELVRMGATNAIVTLGSAGAAGRLDGARWRIGAPPEPGRYPVGSGDAFLAGLAAGRLARMDAEATLRLAASAAAANALVPGAGAFEPAVARDLGSRISVDRID
jgi:1-phosphofructokinase family hexose kinase